MDKQTKKLLKQATEIRIGYFSIEKNFRLFAKINGKWVELDL